MKLQTRIENPKSLISLYGEVPLLNGISLHELRIHRDGPTLRIRFDMPSFPTTPPKKWSPSFNTAQVTLALFGFSELMITGFGTTEIGNLILNQDGDRVAFHFASNSCTVSGTALIANVEGISGYLKEAPEQT